MPAAGWTGRWKTPCAPPPPAWAACCQASNCRSEYSAFQRVPLWVCSCTVQVSRPRVSCFRRFAPMLRSNLFTYAVPADRRTLALILGLVAFSLIVGVNSRLADAARNGLGQLPTEIWLLEASSHLVILALAGVIPLFLDQVPQGIAQRRLFILSLAGFVGFSLLHVSVTYSIRELLFPVLLGRNYELRILDTRVWVYE